MHDKYVRRRRVLIAVLVLISLILLTAYFGEAENSPLHSIQRGIVEVVTPIQDGASKVFSPIRDLAGWFSSTIHAKSQNAQLQAEANRARKVEAQYGYAMAQLAELHKEMRLDNRLNLQQYGLVNANVTEFNPQQFYETVKLDKGSGAGVKVGDPVITGAGLVGKVSEVGDNYAFVAELSSPEYGVEAMIEDGGTGAVGTLEPAIGNPTRLQVNNLFNLPQNQQIGDGEMVVTAGYQLPGHTKNSSLYPPGIPIGRVTGFDYNTLVNDGRVDVSPFVSLRSLNVVQILTKVNG